jgi:acyl-CoA synthetase (NDP forming)
VSNNTADLVGTLREHAFPLDATDDRCVPEPFVKAILGEIGVSVPPGVLVGPGETASAAAAHLNEPLVLKAWGEGVVHKSELGAVRIGLVKNELDAAAEAMTSAVVAHGVPLPRLFVEEMVPTGTELLFGVISRPPFGNLAILGGGGTKAELFGDPVVRLCPIDAATAAEMIEEFRGAPLLRGYRGSAGVDLGALVATMVAIAGVDGLADRLGDDFAEFECNPLFASETGVVAADARLILHKAAETLRPASRPFDANALFKPRSVAVAGASATRANAWGNRTLGRYRQMGWTENLYAVHPTAQIEGVPTYTSLGDIPGGVDFAEISVNAHAVPDVLRGARGNVKTAVITSAGFSELGGEGHALEDELLEAAIEGGIRFVGPNCMGVFSSLGRQGFSGAVSTTAGHIGGAFQSGGLATDLMQVGSALGLGFSNIASAGNTADVHMSDLVAYLLDDPQTRVIALHVEGGADEKLIGLLRKAAGVKPVVLLTPGLSDAGSRIAASHTGAMTSDRRGWQALSGATGLTVTETFEEFLAVVAYLDRYAERLEPAEEAVLILGLGGGASVLGADACDAQGLKVPTLSADLQSRLGDKKGGILLNPLDIRMGPAGPPAAARDAIDIVLASQPFADIMIHVNVMNYANSGVANRLPGVQHFKAMVEALAAGSPPDSRIAIVARNLAQAPGSYADDIRAIMKESPFALFDRFSDAAAAIAAAQRFSRRRAAVAQLPTVKALEANAA